MPRPERPLDDPNDPVTAFAADLRKLREAAGSPVYRVLARRAHFSAATLAAAASGRRLPTLPVLRAYVEACGGDPQEWCSRWHAIAARPTDPGERDPSGSAGARSPYVGLAAFEPEDTELFFGRVRLVEDLTRRLSQRRLLVVFGPSGIGKSSVVRAGLIPAFARSGPTTLLVPDTRPLTALAVRLATAARIPAGALLADLLADPAHAVLAVHQVLKEQDGAQLLLVVDQFEELFSADADQLERDGFIAALVALCQSPDSRARVVLAVRADHYPRFVEFPELLAAMADGQVLVGGMTAAELREAVVRPADRVGARVEGALVAAIVAEVAGRPGALPLASHALLEAWRRRRGTTVTLAGFEAAGGIDEAVARTAEAVYLTWDEARRETARRILTRLVTPHDDAAETRRRVHRRELDLPGVDSVLHELATARLIVLHDDTAEIAHEALIKAWPRFDGWLHADRAALVAHRQLTDAAAVWESVDRDPGALYRGTRLAAVEDWTTRRASELTAAEHWFLKASLARRDRQASAAGRRRRRAVVGLATALLVTGVLATIGLIQSDRAASERDRAVARQLVASAQLHRGTDPELALVLARQAYRLRQDPVTEVTLRQAVADVRPSRTLPHSARVRRLAFGQQGRQLVTGTESDLLSVWDVGTGGAISGHRLPAYGSFALTPDGRQAAVRRLDGDGPVAILPADSPGGRVTTLRGHVPGPFHAIAISADGRQVAVGDHDGGIHLWATPGTRPRPLRGHTALITALTFSPDGRRLASTSVDGTVRVWHLGSAGSPALLRAAPPGRLFNDVKWNPGGDRIAVAGSDGTRIWRADGRGDPVLFNAGQEDVRVVAFSPDGRRIATGSAQHTVRIWDAAAPHRSMPLLGHRGTLNDLAFAPDGRQLASASDDATVRIWDVTGPADPIVARRPVTSAGPSTVESHGRFTAHVGAGDTITVKPVTGTGTATVLRGAPGPIRWIAVSADGRHVAALSGGAVRRWNTSAGRDPTLLPCSSARTSGTTRTEPAWMTISPSGRVAADCGDFTTRIWEHSGTTDPIVLDEFGGPFAFSPDDRLLAGTAGSDTAVHDLHDGGLPRALPGQQGDVWSIDFSPDGRRLATAGSDGAIRIWDLTRAATPSTLAGTTGNATTVAFSPDGSHLVSITDADSVQLLTADSAGPAVTYAQPGPEYTDAVLTPDGRHLVTRHADNSIRVGPCEPCGPMNQIVELADRRATRQLTAEERRSYLSG